jgi:phosphatidylglycerophosphate synthase
MTQTDNRRPLASRDTGWARWLSRRFAATAITPNQISMASMAAAALAGAAFWASGAVDGMPRAALLVAAAVFCQLRLLCNLLDGMVAIEAGRRQPDGAFWNEFPDRVADILILVGAGLGAGEPALGWAAAALAVSTAYVRELGRACGLAADFSGPMAKPHRMALVTLAALASIPASGFWDLGPETLTAALWIVAVGSSLTALRRAVRLVAALRRAGA